MGSGWDPSTSSIRLLRVQPQLPPVGGQFRPEGPVTSPLPPLIVPLQIKAHRRWTPGRANKEAEILPVLVCKALCQELKEALQEADVGQVPAGLGIPGAGTRSWLSVDSIRYGRWAPTGSGLPPTQWVCGGQSLYHLLPGLVGVTRVLLTLGDAPVSPHSESLEFSIASQLPVCLHPRCPSACCVQSIDLVKWRKARLRGFWCN